MSAISQRLDGAPQRGERLANEEIMSHSFHALVRLPFASTSSAPRAPRDQLVRISDGFNLGRIWAASPGIDDIERDRATAAASSSAASFSAAAAGTAFGSCGRGGEGQRRPLLSGEAPTEPAFAAMPTIASHSAIAAIAAIGRNEACALHPRNAHRGVQDKRSSESSRGPFAAALAAATSGASSAASTAEAVDERTATLDVIELDSTAGPSTATAASGAAIASTRSAGRNPFTTAKAPQWLKAADAFGAVRAWRSILPRCR